MCLSLWDGEAGSREEWAEGRITPGDTRLWEVTHTSCHREGRGQPWAGRNSAISVLTWPSTIHLPPDKAKLSSCQVIVHCLAGISRSATIAIAYIMKTMGMSSDDAYRYSSPPTVLGTWNSTTNG